MCVLQWGEIATREPPDSLDELVDLAMRIDRRLKLEGHSTFEVPRLSRTTSAASSVPEPMQVDHTRLLPEKKQRRRDSKACPF